MLDNEAAKFCHSSYESISACQNFWKTFREYENKERYLISYQLLLALIADSYTPTISQLIFYVIQFMSYRKRWVMANLRSGVFFFFWNIVREGMIAG